MESNSQEDQMVHPGARVTVCGLGGSGQTLGENSLLESGQVAQGGCGIYHKDIFKVQQGKAFAFSIYFWQESSSGWEVGLDDLQEFLLTNISVILM